MIFLFHIKVIPANLIIKYTLGNIEFGRFLPHGIKQCPHLYLRFRQNIILEKESPDSNKYKKNNQRPHDLEQRNTRRLYR